MLACKCSSAPTCLKSTSPNIGSSMCAGATACTCAAAPPTSLAQAGDRPGTAHLPAQVLPESGGTPLLAGSTGACAAASPLPWVAPHFYANNSFVQAHIHIQAPQHLLCVSLTGAWACFAVQTSCASVGSDEGVSAAALPITLLTAIVRKEALLPVHTAAFAATQLLPVIHTTIQSQLAATPGNPAPSHLCKELLVSARMTLCRCLADMIPAYLRHAAAEQCSATNPLMLVACKQYLVCLCLIDDVLLPGGQLGVARAAWTPEAAHASSSHGTLLQH